MGYRENVNADRRLALLEALRAAPAYSAPEGTLRMALANVGHWVGRDLLRADLAWLDQMGLVACSQPEGNWVAVLTAVGADCVSGLLSVPGVARPAPA